MATVYSAFSVPSAPRRKWDVHKILLLFCAYAVAARMYTIWTSGGWADRSQFFGEGELKPGLVDFVFNEIMLYYLLIRVLINKPNILVYTLIIFSSLAYYTRVPLILMFFVLVLAKQLSFKLKMLAGAATLVLSFVVLYLRIGDDLIYGEDASVFYIGYAFIGIGRLLQTDVSIDATALHYLTLFIKPFDAIIFLIDYIGAYGGQLSAGRFAGLEISRFEYIQSLQGAYNAFGTVLYPFILIGGWVVGPLLFLLFLLFQQLTYSFATHDRILSTRYLAFLLVTGTFFSWSSPFAWLAPFIFTKVRDRRAQ